MLSIKDKMMSMFRINVGRYKMENITVVKYTQWPPTLFTLFNFLFKVWDIECNINIYFECGCKWEGIQTVSYQI